MQSIRGQVQASSCLFQWSCVDINAVCVDINAVWQNTWSIADQQHEAMLSKDFIGGHNTVKTKHLWAWI